MVVIARNWNILLFILNKRFLRKPAAVRETGLGKCNAIFNRCKYSMLLGSKCFVLQNNIVTDVDRYKFFKRCTSFQIIEYPP